MIEKYDDKQQIQYLIYLRLSILLFIFTLNLKSEFSKVFAFIPYPSDPKSRIFFPFQLCFVKSFFAVISNALTQNSFVFKNFKVVFILETLKILICSVPPLALLYRSLLLDGKDLSLTIIPSILNATALLIIEPIFLGSVTSSRAIKFTFLFLFSITNSFKVISSNCSTSATKP